MLLKFRHFARCFIGSERAPAAVPLPDNDDLLGEILLRLPPLPSSLPRASLVCKRWRRLVADPVFLRRFRQRHHGAPPLLGYFFSGRHGPVFAPTLPAPDCIPPERFSLPRPEPADERLFLLGCRHGLALLINRRRLEAVVWDPVSGCRATVAYPPEFTTDNGAHCCRGTVLSTAADGVGDNGQLRPFKVILVRTDVDNGHISVCMCVYDSKTGKWGHTISSSTAVPFSASNLPSVLIGNTLCGFLQWPQGILEFDLKRHSLGIIKTPKCRHPIETSSFQVLRTQDGELGFAILSKLSMELWGRKASSSSDGGAAGWVLQKTIQLDSLLSLPPRNMMGNSLSAWILGFDEDNNVIHVSTITGAFAIRLDSMKFAELFNINRIISCHQSCYPYTGFYTAEGAALPMVETLFPVVVRSQ